MAQLKVGGLGSSDFIRILIIILLFLIPPAGIPLLWFCPSLSKKWKSGLSIAGVFWLFVLFVASISPLRTVKELGNGIGHENPIVELNLKTGEEKLLYKKPNPTIVTSGNKGFNQSCASIIDSLGNPIRLGPIPSYLYTVRDWENSDLYDGTPRLLTARKREYNYELLGDPIYHASIMTDIFTIKKDPLELYFRILLLLNAVAPCKNDQVIDDCEKLGRSFVEACKNPDKKILIKMNNELVTMTVTSISIVLVEIDHP